MAVEQPETGVWARTSLNPVLPMLQNVVKRVESGGRAQV